ncbi:hypothetical protein HK096_003610, partial [Nowakowskiella sp. JEL0078]
MNNLFALKKQKSDVEDAEESDEEFSDEEFLECNPGITTQIPSSDVNPLAPGLDSLSLPLTSVTITMSNSIDPDTSVKVDQKDEK